MDEWVVLLHVAAAFWFVAGLLGRNITMARARTATDIRTLDDLKSRLTGVIVVGLMVAFLGVAIEWKGGTDIAAIGIAIAGVIVGVGAYYRLVGLHHEPRGGHTAPIPASDWPDRSPDQQ